MLTHVAGLILSPSTEWKKIREEESNLKTTYVNHVLILAAIPAVCGFIGTTLIGWRIGAGDPVSLTVGSALAIAVAFYLAMLVGVYAMGRFIFWMADTFGTSTSVEKAVAVAAYMATPLFLVGFSALYPALWLNMLIGLVAVGYTIYLLYSGIPVVFDISKDQGFVFSSSVVTVGLVMLVAMLAVTVILWGFGFAPQFSI
jgi:hypothetical protein